MFLHTTTCSFLFSPIWCSDDRSPILSSEKWTMTNQFCIAFRCSVTCKFIGKICRKNQTSVRKRNAIYYCYYSTNLFFTRLRQSKYRYLKCWFYDRSSSSNSLFAFRSRKIWFARIIRKEKDIELRLTQIAS